MSLFEIKCPLCKGVLWIDPATQRVVDHKTPDQPKADFKDFLKSREKGTAWDEKMRQAKEGEAKRKAEIEAKFKGVKDEKADLSEKSPFNSPLDWD